MLMTRRPDEVKMLMIDPKMVELSPYKRLPHLMHPVVTDMRKAEAILAWAVEKMEERYALLARAGVRHVSVYNQLGEEELMDRLQPETDEERASIPLHLPYIVIVADEMADLMMTSGKEVEQHIIRLAQKSRAVGIHLILATQKPTVDVITGLIKSNLPARIAFQVASRVDSRVVLDEMGAERLLGNGDMLFLWPGTSMLLRGQGTYLSDDEINKVVDFVGTTEPQFAKELVALRPKSDDPNKPGISLQNRDELYETAVDIVIREGRGSVSLLQRALGIGYGRAARLIDYMAEDGIVGEYNGSQAREVLITLEQWAEMSGSQTEPEPPPKPKRNVIMPERGDELDEQEKEADDEEDDGDDGDDPPPIRGPHNRPKGASTFGDRVPLEPRSKGGFGARMALEDEDSEDDDDFEDDEDLDEEDFESDEDAEDTDDADDSTSDDDRYANVNPALLARLRQKKLREREQRFRRSA
jgi:S-DNA-T family DNA segregation ATPase FtsK/SpoIIIE